MNNCITIGMDLGNRNHKIVAVDDRCQIAFKLEIANSREALEPFFRKYAGSTVAMETGTCCRWISALARDCGCDALVGNARKLRMIWQSSQKNDWKDAQMIAQVAKTSRELFHPVDLRDDEHHNLVQLIALRAAHVRQRTQSINSIRGMCKTMGYFIPKCDAEYFSKHLDRVPGSEMWKFAPLLERLGNLDEVIREYERKISDYADVHFGGKVALLMTVPGVGIITASAYVAYAAKPDRFGRARDAGCYFGLTAGQDQSGEIDKPKHITKAGSEVVRSLLTQSANNILRESAADNALKRYGLRICSRGGKVSRRKAKTAVARKLAVIMMAMLQSGKPYDDGLAATFQVQSEQEH